MAFYCRGVVIPPGQAGIALPNSRACKIRASPGHLRRYA